MLSALLCFLLHPDALADVDVSRCPPSQRMAVKGPDAKRALIVFDSLFDSLPRTLCDASGRSETQTRHSAEYWRHALTLPVMS
jgi:hypothetical protein